MLRAQAQSPATVVPIVVDTAVPIIVNAVKPKPTGLAKFEGFVMNANTAQITVRAKGNDMAVRTFTLSEESRVKNADDCRQGRLSVRRQNYGLYDPASHEGGKSQRETLEVPLIHGASACFVCPLLQADFILPMPAELSTLIAEYRKKAEWSNQRKG